MDSFKLYEVYTPISLNVSLFVWPSKFSFCIFIHCRSHRQGKMILHYGDLIDGNCLVKIINDTKPTEIYNLGAQSHVKVGKV